MVEKKECLVVEGEVHVCAHRVSWWFELEGKDDEDDADELKERLEEEAEERAKACIIEGYVSGELAWYDSEREQEYFGWWDIIRD